MSPPPNSSLEEHSQTPLQGCFTVLEEPSKALRHFVRSRRRGSSSPQPPVDVGFALRIEFDQPLAAVRFPTTLGYASHFGLGLFAAVNL